MRWRGKRIKLFPICTDEKLQVKGNPLVQDLATCTVPHQLKAAVVSIGCNSRLIIRKKHWQRSFILKNLHPRFSVTKLLKKCLWFCTFHTKPEENGKHVLPQCNPSEPTFSPGAGCHFRVWLFFGTAGRLACHKWLWMVRASTLTDMVLAGITLNCFLSELYL